MKNGFKKVIAVFGLVAATGMVLSPALAEVALITVGETSNLDEAKEVKQKGKAKKVFAELFEQVQ